MVGAGPHCIFPRFRAGMQAAITRGMRLASSGFALVTALAIFHAETAHAQEQDFAPPPKVHARSSTAYGAGVALTVTGSVFLAGGLVAGVGGIVIASSSGGGEGGGIGLAFAFVGGLIWAGATAVGVATLVPGIVLMVKNATPTPREPVYRDARYDVPAPRFMSVPILSGTF